jgi:hypothetical protein
MNSENVMDGLYGWMPVAGNTSIEVYIDGKRLRIEVGTFHDGVAERRGLHIVGPMNMQCEMTSVNACSVFTTEERQA